MQVLHNKPFAVNAEIDKPYILAQKPAVSSAQTAQQAIEHFFNAAHRLNDESTQTFSQRTLLGESGLASLGEPPDSSGRQSESARQSQESRQIEEARLSDEAEIYAGSPPPDSAKMLTRVGWCEVQTFGHTFANRHLTARLRQLSKAVLPKIRSDSDLQLMDDLSRIENAVIAGDAGRKPAVAPTK